ncbi:MAG: hypothetical protein GXO27_03470 [Chlorobi bacterium]|nr:hypothetical protein [Chlorobiota bacterium]
MKYSLWFIIVLLVISACRKEDARDAYVDYRQEMRTLVQEISTWSKAMNPEFAIIPQNGVELLTSDGEPGRPAVTEYIDALDGIGQEELFYGYTADDEPTPPEITRRLTGFLDLACSYGLTVLVTDYCYTPARVDSSYMLNHARGYVSFAADSRELDRIPSYPQPIFMENNLDISRLSEIRNFLYLINPDSRFSSKTAFIQAVQNTNYDLIITDLFFDGQSFTPAEIRALEQKANGGRRLVIAYMSIGEAEDYRYYWQPDWRPGHPSFIVAENPEWEGNYIVKYWDPRWKQIVRNYLTRILDAGFDGVYLDIIDAYEYFEEAEE